MGARKDCKSFFMGSIPTHASTDLIMKISHSYPHTINHEDRIPLAGKIVSAVHNGESVEFTYVYDNGRPSDYTVYTFLYHMILAERADFNELNKKYQNTIEKLKSVSKELSKLKKT